MPVRAERVGVLVDSLELAIIAVFWAGHRDTRPGAVSVKVDRWVVLDDLANLGEPVDDPGGRRAWEIFSSQRSVADLSSSLLLTHGTDDHERDLWAILHQLNSARLRPPRSSSPVPSPCPPQAQSEANLP